jgi:hypothetical protein
MKWFNGKKTYIVSAFMVMVSLMHLATGDLTLTEFVSSDHTVNLLEALGLSTLRVGIWQNQKDAAHEIVKNIHFPHAG